MAAAAPWFKFYPRDWRGDQALRACSAAARGLWMECLCIMHEATPYGHLLLNGKPPDGVTLARMVGMSVDEVSACMAELRQAGVLSLTSKGHVISRRMVADHARAAKGRKAVNSRWTQQAEIVQETARPNRAPNSIPNRSPITQKPETRKIENNLNRCTSEAARAPGLDAAAAADRSPSPVIDLAALERSLRQAAGLEHDPSPGLLDLSPVLGLLAQGVSLSAVIEPKLRAAAAQGRRGRSWAYYARIVTGDGPRSPAAQAGAGPAAMDPDDYAEWRNRVVTGRQLRKWYLSWGPLPNQPGCQAPPEFVQAGDGQDWQVIDPQQREAG